MGLNSIRETIEKKAEEKVSRTETEKALWNTQKAAEEEEKARWIIQSEIKCVPTKKVRDHRWQLIPLYYLVNKPNAQEAIWKILHNRIKLTMIINAMHVLISV